MMSLLIAALNLGKRKHKDNTNLWRDWKALPTNKQQLDHSKPPNSSSIYRRMASI
jgi:hypothetical protein